MIKSHDSSFSSATLTPETAFQAFDQAQVMLRERDGTVLYWARGNVRLYGYEPEEAVGRVSHALLGTRFPKALRDIEAELEKTGKWSGELAHRRKDSSEVLVATQWSLVDTAQGVLIAEVNNDLSEARRLQAAEAYTAEIIASSHDAIISKSLDGTIRSWNPAAEAILGYSAAEAIGRNIKMLFPPDLVAEEDEIVARITRGEKIPEHETRRVRKDGTEIIASILAWPIYASDGRLLGATKVLRDVTAERKAQEQIEAQRLDLIHMSRVISLGTLATWIAHELNQPLASIINYLAALRRQVQSGSASPALIVDISSRTEKQAVRAAQIIQRLRAMAEHRDPLRREEDVVATVREALELTAPMIKHYSVDVSLMADPGLPHALIDRVQIQQVLLNVMRNACEAMAGRERRALDILITAEAETLHVAVRDTGPGISEAAAATLFQPFASSSANGMGIGLSISKQIIDMHGGSITASPRSPEGTVFDIRIPAWPGAETAAP